MATETAITAEYVRSRLDYDPETGVLTWKRRPGNDHQTNAWNAKFIGRPAGSLIAAGYLEVGIKATDGTRVRTYAHRLAWLITHGDWPLSMVDHIDGDKVNNRLSNLRLATNAENLRNRGPKATNPSGVKGVSWDGRRRKWVATITVNYKCIHLGRHKTIGEAAAAYAEAAARLHGEFARTK